MSIVCLMTPETISTSPDPPLDAPLSRSVAPLSRSVAPLSASVAFFNLIGPKSSGHISTNPRAITDVYNK